MKRTITYSIFIFIFCFSCNSSEKTEQLREERKKILDNANVSVPSIKSSMTFYDTDSIYNQKFITRSINNGKSLYWEIDIYENNKKVKQIIDSSEFPMSYLVDACDLNSDNIGELVLVAANNNIVCKTYCYLKDGNIWTKRMLPELNEKQLEGYNGSETITVKKNKIIRKYLISKNDTKETVNKRVFIYRLDKKLNLILQ